MRSHHMYTLVGLKQCVEADLNGITVGCAAEYVWSSSPILQVGVEPGQLAAVHQVLGVAQVGQRVGVVAQVGQGVSVIVGSLHHGVQQRVLAVGGRVRPVGSVWRGTRERSTELQQIQY